MPPNVIEKFLSLNGLSKTKFVGGADEGFGGGDGILITCLLLPLSLASLLTRFKAGDAGDRLEPRLLVVDLLRLDCAVEDARADSSGPRRADSSGRTRADSSGDEVLGSHMDGIKEPTLAERSGIGYFKGEPMAMEATVLQLLGAGGVCRESARRTLVRYTLV
mmetsp:Transcript_102931/g.169335  ORF Transcript_102931/g.169335 Transcript_102931/m.169335 type:complete len:163 (-) Transcript_102931:81-569(-)